MRIIRFNLMLSKTLGLALLILLISQNSEAQMEVDHLSLLTTPVLLCEGEKAVSQGTGFYYALSIKEQDKQKTVVFLVTNYHVLTGAAPSDHKEAIGDNIVFYLHKDKLNPGNTKAVRYPLYTKERRPTWLVSREFPDADIAIIPLVSSVISDVQVSAISKEWAEKRIKLRPSSTITLVGYPHGYSDKVNALPIWKTGNIASEPEVDFEGKPLFVADVSAYPGMSGAPVFAIAYGMYESEQGTTAVGGARQFLGIFASMEMIKEDKFLEELTSDSKKGIKLNQSLQLGHVWKSKLIKEMVESIDVQKYQEDIIKHL